MTKITRRVTRETSTDYAGEKLVVELFPRTMLIRPKRSRAEGHAGVFVSYDAIYELGLKLAARHPDRHPKSDIRNPRGPK